MARYLRQAVSIRIMARWASRVATTDVRGWLRKLDLERYEAAFRENHINERVLPTLTQEDLKEMGVGARAPARLEPIR